MKRVLLAMILAAAASQAAADPHPQLVASIENRLKFYHLQADVSQFSTSTVAQLHFAS